MNEPASSRVDAVLLLATCAAALAVGVFLLSLHRLGDRPILGPLGSLARLGILASAAAAMCAVALVVWRLRGAGPGERRQRRLTLLMGLATVTAVLLMGEAAVRLFSVRQAGGRVFLGTRLLPRRWVDEATRYLAFAAADEYLAYDDRLGWSLAPGRASRDGLYFSSAEGLRAPAAGDSVLAPDVRPGEAAPIRVALVGDSYTFGEDVTYEDTWGYQLERLLCPGVRVRNFGVPGYGLDQAVLRYERDVRPWRPRIVILAPIQHDILRSMTVYTFLAFPDWELPYSKPRFVLRDGDLVLVNSPTLPPRDVFAYRQVTDLPLLEYDVGYDLDEWQRRPWDASWLVRFLASRFPPLRSPAESPDSSMRESAVNRAVLWRFVDQVGADGAVAILARLPSPTELLDQPATRYKISRQLIDEVGDEAHVRHTDLSDALRTVDPARLRAATGRAWHYSPEANRVVAERFATMVREILRAEPSDPGPGAAVGSGGGLNGCAAGAAPARDRAPAPPRGRG
jgi:hypothetical protein